MRMKTRTRHKEEHSYKLRPPPACQGRKHAADIRIGSLNRNAVNMTREVLCCTAAAFLLYICTIQADFAYDDSRAVLKNQDLRPETPLSNLFLDDFWGTPLTHSGSHKSYRPICVLTYRLNYYIHGLSPGGYHLANVLLHSVVTSLYTALIATLTRRRIVSLVAGLLFAVHPIHTEAVAGVVGRADVLCALFFLLTLFSYIRYCQQRRVEASWRWVWMGAVLLMTTASMLSKELGITVLAVCLVYDFFLNQPAKAPLLVKLSNIAEAVVSLGLIGGFLLLLRLYYMGFTTPEFSPADNPAASSDSLLTRTLTFFYLTAFNFYLLVFPITLSFDWSMDAIPVVETLADIRVISTLVFCISLLLLLKYLFFYYVIFETTTEKINDHQYSKDIPNGLLLKSKVCRASKSNGEPDELAHNGHNGYSNSSCSGSNGLRMQGHVTSHCMQPLYGAAETSSLVHRKQRRFSTSSSESNCDENQNEIVGNQDRHFGIVTLGLALMAVPFLPAANLCFYVGFVIAERVLYVPSMGYCLLVAELVFQIHKKIRNMANLMLFFWITISIIALFMGIRTYARCQDWMSEEQLYMSGIAVNPAKAWGNLANVLNSQGRAREAEQAYRKALNSRGNMADVHYNLGILLQDQRRYQEAISEYNMAIKCRPRLTVAHLNLGIVLALLGQYQEAIMVYNHCAEMDIDGLKDPRLHESAKISALYNLGRLYTETRQYQLAVSTFHLALSRRPEYYAPQSIYNMLGEVYFHLGNLDDAELWYLKALKAKPDHLPAYLTMARLLHKKNNSIEAENWYLKALKLNPSDPSNYKHYAHFLTENGRQEEALHQWLKAEQLQPDDFDGVFNTASALRQMGRLQEAEEYYKRAAILSPQSATAHMNLGAMYHINKKYKEAEISYMRALDLEPNDTVTQNNLKKLRNLMGKR